MKTAQKEMPLNFEMLHEKYAHFFTEAKELRPKSDCVFFMCIDAEWYPNPVKSDQNIVLSYQIATASPWETKNIIRYMKPHKRLTLVEIIESGLKSVMPEEYIFKMLKNKKIAVILISHNFTAEWSVLSDRNESYITKRLALIRGQPITDGHAIILPTTFCCSIKVKIFDTMLLAPASHLSLKKLSKLLGNENLSKGEVSQKYIENMNLYLQDFHEDFETYALQDTKITLMLFFLLQEALNKLVNDLEIVKKEPKFKLYRTLASAGVKSFTNNNDTFADYRKEIKYKYKSPYSLISRSYFGGRNEGYFIGRTANHPETKNKIWIDIDFTGCYPTAMATCPKIDITKEAEYLPPLYIFDNNTALALAKHGIPENLITSAREALTISLADFENFLLNMAEKEYAKKIRQQTVSYDNRLIEKWKKIWESAQQGGNDFIDKITIPGFAKIHFKFPPDTLFPCLPIRHRSFGLLYVLEGETIATATEILLALEAGAEINALTSAELPVELDPKDNQPVRLFLDHLKTLNEKRNSYKPGKPQASEVMEKLVKEFTNSFYGKVAQGINPKRVFKPSTREQINLGESDVTEACTASLITSLARAALAATLIATERFNQGKPLAEQITVVSATTDGLLIGVPTPENFTVIDDYYTQNPIKLKNVDLMEILKRFGCGELIDEMSKFLPIKVMRNSRAALTLKDDQTFNDEILEIKHIADEIISIKTRGQIGIISNGDTVLLARCNIKAPLEEIIENPEEYRRIFLKGGTEEETIVSNWIVSWLDAIENGHDEIPTYHKITLRKFTEIYKSSELLDVTKKIKSTKINLDFDWKRKIIFEKCTGQLEKTISPHTVPYKNQRAMLSHRYSMESIRKKGFAAQPDKVIQGVAFKKASLNTRGGPLVTVTKIFLRGLAHGKIPVEQPTGSYSLDAEKLNKVWEENGHTTSNPKKWTINDLKYAKRKDWIPCDFNPVKSTKELIIALSKEFTADPTKTLEAIFSAEETKGSTGLIGYVITAVSNAHKRGISPFTHLHEEGLLPSWEIILDNFSERLQEKYIIDCARHTFTPGEQPPYQARALRKIFEELGIPKDYSMACARSLAPLPTGPRKESRNPQEIICTKLFIQAISQPDFKNRNIYVSEVIGKLKKYGVTKHLYYNEIKKAFSANNLKKTKENIKQITDMAKAMGHLPQPFIDALIETS